jgi:thiol-disulfide isomerase/thioredoxin
MTEIRFVRAACLSVALSVISGVGDVQARARGQEGAKPAAAQKKNAQSGDAKSGAAVATKQGKTAAAAAASLPQVREINEEGLKALLEEHSKAGRRLLINFWATWCTPCREEFPDLVKVDKEFAGLGDFEFITVSLDDVSEIGGSVPTFLGEMHAAGMPAYLLNAKDQEAAIVLIERGWQGNLPATFLFGRGGELLFSHKGRIRAGELRKAIKDSEKTVISDK